MILQLNPTWLIWDWELIFFVNILNQNMQYDVRHIHGEEILIIL